MKRMILTIRESDHHAWRDILLGLAEGGKDLALENVDDAGILVQIDFLEADYLDYVNAFGKVIIYVSHW